MEKWPVILGLFFAFIIGIGVGGVYFGGPITSNWEKAYALSEIRGSQVRNMRGEDLGTLNDFVINTDGRVGFAIISHADKLVAVPFEAITYDRAEKQLTLNMSKEKIDSAPAFDKTTDLSRAAWAEDIYNYYKYYGVQPNWGEKRLGERQGWPGTMEKAPSSGMKEQAAPTTR